jgi:predicted CopG family antitoxin
MNEIAKKLKEDKIGNKLTTIAISKENYFILKKMGQTSDSFNDVLSRLLKNNYLLESTGVRTST